VLRIFHTGTDRTVHKSVGLTELSVLDRDSIIWIDLHYPTPEEIETVEAHFGITFQNPLEAQEIESSSRYFENEDTIHANSNFLVADGDGFKDVNVSMILRGRMLVTYRNADIKTFAETVRKIKANSQLFEEGGQVMVTIYETRIDLDADQLELVAKEINAIGKTVTLGTSASEEALLQITRLQESTILMRESIIDKQRAVSALMRSYIFPKQHQERLRVIIKDINSLLGHTSFSFERLEYLQNTLLGLINIEQNKIIKIFTVVSVVFMPPTLIASIYGMNFQLMPELGFNYGYPLAILLMIASSLGTLYVFKKRRWL
jgi:magnesium transporter